MISFSKKAVFKQPGIVVLVTKEQVSTKRFNFDYSELKDEIAQLAKVKQFVGEKGEMYPLMAEDQTVVLVGLGDGKKLSPTSLRIQVRRAILSGFLKRIKKIDVVPHKTDDKSLISIIEGAELGGYAWRKYITPPKKPQMIWEKEVSIAAASKKILTDAVVTCAGVNLARDLINENADIMTSVYMEKIIKELIKGHKNVSIQVLNAKEMKAKGLGFHLAVNQGSNKEPKLIIVKYNGARKQGDYTALIGKGITYDTGGLNIKPTGYMEDMRIDMSGSAAVVGALKNVLALKPKKNIIFAVGMAENAVDKDAYKPGDVFKGYAGKTVEIGNTDAEGRLVLADAIAYVKKNYSPARIVDLATLTGACVMALGNDHAGLLSNNDKFAQSLLKCAKETDDRAWQLPLYEEAQGYMKSKIADLKNTSSIRGAGTITAAVFLSKFVGDTPWVHLDIAGTAFVNGDSHWYFGHGGTGAGVRLLTQYLTS